MARGKTGRTNSKSARGSARRKAAQAKGYRSAFELDMAKQMEAEGIEFDYEPEEEKMIWVPKQRTYLPDFRLKNGVLVETKGRLTNLDKQKMIAVVQQHPNKDIRMVFATNNKLNPRAKMRYLDWAKKNGIQAAVGKIPKEWSE